jgi:pyridoxamine 5'-phosphate oxidase
MVPEQSLPEPLPAEPMHLVQRWLAEATQRCDQPNPNAMVLATCGADGRPAARVVLCKEIDAATGTVGFVSNYRSRKGQELAANPRAALVFHWDHLHRQVRLEGVVRRASVTRPRASQLGAHASAQSQPVASIAALRAQLDEVAARYPGNSRVPRPAHWGGYVMAIDCVELWTEGNARLHERAQWQRELADSCSAQPVASPWSVTRLQP